MYWSVIGAFVAFEYVAEWLISWQALMIDYSGTPSQTYSFFAQAAILLGSQDYLVPLPVITPDSGMSSTDLVA
jgi:hypothetical protein